jgi:NTP pyrophosphatase (non-canonical NTP hydrolase)
MKLKDIQKFQAEYDKKYWRVNKRIPTRELLLFLSTALAGEMGEFANLVKKLYRQKRWRVGYARDKKRNLKAEMADELIDVFIYTLIIAETLGIDLEKEYFKKQEKNIKRFKK